jgi:hypothetical protein
MDLQHVARYPDRPSASPPVKSFEFLGSFPPAWSGMVAQAACNRTFRQPHVLT